MADLAGSPKNQGLQAQATRYASCPYATNLAAQAIRDVVTSYRLGGQLKYVVIAGGDAVVPFFRYADASGLATEDGYVPPLTSTTRSAAALATSSFLTDDPYGAQTVLSRQNSDLPVPDLAVGRLVETADEITRQVQSYLNRPVLPKPTSSLVTGYDFLQPVADQVEQAFKAGMDDPAGSTAQHDQLITDQGVPTTRTGTGRLNSWTADDLRRSLFGSHHDLLFLGGHFSANNTLAADYTSTVVTTEVQRAVAANPTLFSGSVILSAGCHGGYNLQDSDGVPGITLGLDWTQALTSAGAALISGTGYQYGDTDFIAYSDKLYVDLARLLRRGSGSQSLGQLLVAAKQQYLRQVPTLSGMDTKALLTTTLFGLPMLGIDMPYGRTPAATATTGTTTPTAVTTGRGQTLGLSQASLTVATPTTPKSRPVDDLAGVPTAAQYTWLTGSDGVTTQPGQPALPLQTVDVTATDGSVLRGVGLRTGTYVDTPGIVPLVGAPATELSQVHTPFASQTWFPQTLASGNWFGTLSGSGGTTLNLTPAQLKADSATTDTLRRYSDLGLSLYYSENTTLYGGNVPALASAPTISQVASTVQPNGSVTVSTHVATDPSAGVQGVWVTWTGESATNADHGRWQSVDLVQDTTDSTLWTGTFTPAQAGDTRFLLQAVNGVGVVGLDNAGGALYEPGTSPGTFASGATSTMLTLASVNSSAVRGSTLDLRATLSDVPASGAAGAPLPSQQVTFAVGALTVTATTDGTGTASAQLPVLGVPGVQTVSVSYAGVTSRLPSAASAQVTVTPPASRLDVAPAGADVTSGSASSVRARLTSNGKPLAGRPVSFVVTDARSQVVSSTVRTTDGDGSAALGAVTVAAGTNTVTATYDGTAGQVGGGQAAISADYLPSTASALVHGISPTRTTLSTGPGPVTYGSPVTLTALVEPGGGNGTVSFTVDGAALPGCAARPLSALPSADVATCSVASWSAGSHSAVAIYSGDADHLTSTSNRLDVTVDKGTTTSSVTAPATVTWGTAVTVTATVVPKTAGALGTGATGPRGTVTFWDNDDQVGVPVAVAADGTATLTIPARSLGAGPQAWQAMYSGDANWDSSAGSGATTVTRATTSTQLVTPAPVVYGQVAVLTASVSPSDGGGTVAFTVDGLRVPTCSAVPVTGSGVSGSATCSVSGLDVGTHSVVVSFSGDTNLVGSSGTGAVTVNFTRTISGTNGGRLIVGAREYVLVSGTQNGGVTVTAGGSLKVTGTINGAVTASAAARIVLGCGAVVNGGVSATGTTGAVVVGAPTCNPPVSVQGGLSLSGSTGPVTVTGASINGSVTVTGATAPVVLSGNRISGALSCSGNTPAPVNGGVPNTASSRSGQCAVPATF
ncbi:MAG: Ig-like domain repeat protein [Pseudorhodobacter sp.]|nr:Ig-like domain repeat protein [Frankiaceae bacterium]